MVLLGSIVQHLHLLLELLASWHASGWPTESPRIQDQVPSKAEKAELEKSKRVVSGFEVSKDWSASFFETRLSTQSQCPKAFANTEARIL